MSGRDLILAALALEIKASELVFKVDSGRSALFTNPPGIENILSRMTGTNPSNILRTLGVTGGNANLFLITAIFR